MNMGSRDQQKTNLLFIILKIRREILSIREWPRGGRVEDRLKEHLPTGPDPVLGGAKVKIQQKPSIAEAKKAEAKAIKRNQPPQNKKGK